MYICLPMKDIIKDILVSNLGRQPAFGLRPRNTGISLELDKIQAIIGPRRVGKASAMLLTIDLLKKHKNISEEYISISKTNVSSLNPTN